MRQSCRAVTPSALDSAPNAPTHSSLGSTPRQVTLLYPVGGESSAEVFAGEVLTPGSWVLDATPGKERFVALFSDRNIPLEEVRRTIEAAANSAVVVPGAHSVERSCLKEAP